MPTPKELLLAAFNDDDSARVSAILTQNPELINQDIDSYNTALFKAIEHCNMDVVSAVIEQLPDKNTLNTPHPKTGYTPLHTAIKCDNMHALEALLSQGANPSICSHDYTALDYAIFTSKRREHSLYAIDRLIGEEVNPKTLACAAQYGSGALIGHIINRYCEQNKKPEVVNAQDSRKRTPLMHAALSNNISTLKHLLDQPDCTIELKDDEGQTALSLAVKKNLFSPALHLLRAGALFEESLLESPGISPQMHTMLEKILHSRNHTSTNNLDMLTPSLQEHIKDYLNPAPSVTWASLIEGEREQNSEHKELRRS